MINAGAPLVAGFFDETWLFWWLFALVAILRWYWIHLGASERTNDDGKPWRELDQAAVLERETADLRSGRSDPVRNVAQAFGDHDPEQR